MVKPIAVCLVTFALVALAGCQQKKSAAVSSVKCMGCFSGPITHCAQIADWDVAVIARVTKLSPLNGFQHPQATFEIVDVLKGQSLVPAQKQLTIGIDGNVAVGDVFIVVTDVQDGVKWSRVEQTISAGSQAYLTALFRLPTAAERQLFHLQHLTAVDEDVAADAFQELDSLKYTELQHLRPHLQHAEILARIQEPEIAASRKRLAFRMLSICGSEQDLPFLENILQSPNRHDRSGLDAAIGCYLTLKGADGLPLIEQNYLQNKQASYADTYCAIMAIRFHLAEVGAIDHARLIESLRIMLQRPELADLVIPDLAQQQDWSVLESLFELFKQEDPRANQSWLRIPVINYLRKCPLPRAKQLLAECEQIDPEAVKRAQALFPSAGN